MVHEYTVISSLLLTAVKGNPNLLNTVLKLLDEVSDSQMVIGKVKNPSFHVAIFVHTTQLLCTVSLIPTNIGYQVYV